MKQRKSTAKKHEKVQRVAIKDPKHTVEYSQQCTKLADENVIDYDTWYKNYLALKERGKNFVFRKEVKELREQEKQNK